MRMNIYVQDDLAERVRSIKDLNVSSVCQSALESEVDRREAAAKLRDGMKRVEVYVDEHEGREINGDLAFVGREIANDRRNITAYLTDGNRIAVYDHDPMRLYVYETFSDFAADDGVGMSNHPDLVADVAQELGEKRIIELDI